MLSRLTGQRNRVFRPPFACPRAIGGRLFSGGRPVSVAHDVDVEDPTGRITGERRLWAEALGQLLRDGIAYWKNKGAGGSPADYELEAAFDDLCRAGPMTRRLCDRLEVDPETVAEQFIRYCEGL